MKKAEAKLAQVVSEGIIAKARAHKAEVEWYNAQRQADECVNTHKAKGAVIRRIKALMTNALSAGSVCSHCGMTVDAAHVKAHTDSLRLELEAAAKEELEADRYVLIASNDLNDKVQVHTAQRASLGLIEQQKYAAEKELNVAQTQATVLKLLEEKLAAKKLEKNPHPATVNRAVAEINKLKVEREEFKNQLTYAQKSLKVYQYLNKAFGNKGLKSLLLDSSIPTLNKHAERYSRLLTGGNLEVEFDTQSQLKSGSVTDRFEVKVRSLFGGESYEELSGGEKVKVDICVALALQSLVASRARASINIAVFDESTIYLDDTAGEHFMNLLADEAKRKSSIFCITHDQSLKSYFPSSILIRKRNGISTLEKA